MIETYAEVFLMCVPVDWSRLSTRSAITEIMPLWKVEMASFLRWVSLMKSTVSRVVFAIALYRCSISSPVFISIALMLSKVSFRASLSL